MSFATRIHTLASERPGSEEKEVLEALRKSRGSVRGAAKLLGVSYSTLYKVMNLRKKFYREKIVAARLGEL